MAKAKDKNLEDRIGIKVSEAVSLFKGIYPAYFSNESSPYYPCVTKATGKYIRSNGKRPQTKMVYLDMLVDVAMNNSNQKKRKKLKVDEAIALDKRFSLEEGILPQYAIVDCILNTVKDGRTKAGLERGFKGYLSEKPEGSDEDVGKGLDEEPAELDEIKEAGISLPDFSKKVGDYIEISIDEALKLVKGVNKEDFAKSGEYNYLLEEGYVDIGKLISQAVNDDGLEIDIKYAIKLDFELKNNSGYDILREIVHNVKGKDKKAELKKKFILSLGADLRSMFGLEVADINWELPQGYSLGAYRVEKKVATVVLESLFYNGQPVTDKKKIDEVNDLLQKPLDKIQEKYGITVCGFGSK